MDAFSYLSVLLSIIIGLGFTQVLTASGRLIRHRAHVRLYWLPLLWAAVLLVIYVQVWWAMFGLREHSDWTFLAFFVVLLQTVTAYMMSAVALPDEIGTEGVDLRLYYDRQHRWFFGFLLATVFVSVLKDYILSGHLPGMLNLAFHALLTVACLAGIMGRARRTQEVIGVTCAICMGAYITLLFGRLQ